VTATLLLVTRASDDTPLLLVTATLLRMTTASDGDTAASDDSE